MIVARAICLWCCRRAAHAQAVRAGGAAVLRGPAGGGGELFATIPSHFATSTVFGGWVGLCYEDQLEEEVKRRFYSSLLTSIFKRFRRVAYEGCATKTCWRRRALCYQLCFSSSCASLAESPSMHRRGSGLYSIAFWKCRGWLGPAPR